MRLNSNKHKLGYFLVATLLILAWPGWTDAFLIGTGLGLFVGVRLLFKPHPWIWLAAGVILVIGAFGSMGGTGTFLHAIAGSISGLTALLFLRGTLTAR